jgi:hypothetical protein
VTDETRGNLHGGPEHKDIYFRGVRPDRLVEALARTSTGADPATRRPPEALRTEAAPERAVLPAAVAPPRGGRGAGTRRRLPRALRSRRTWRP